VGKRAEEEKASDGDEEEATMEIRCGHRLSYRSNPEKAGRRFIEEIFMSRAPGRRGCGLYKGFHTRILTAGTSEILQKKSDSAAPGFLPSLAIRYLEDTASSCLEAHASPPSGKHSCGTFGRIHGKSQRLVIATLSASCSDLLLWLCSSGPQPLAWPVALQIILSRTLIVSGSGSADSRSGTGQSTDW